MKSTSVISLLSCASAASAGFIHWGHHGEDVVKIHKGWGPFDGVDAVPQGFLSTCENTKSFKAKQFKKSDIHKNPPQGLRPWSDAIDRFIESHEYPGHWKGDDEQGSQRDYIVMEYTDVPKAVKDWLATHHDRGFGDHRKWFFAVFRKPKGGENITETLKPALPRATPAPGAEGGSSSSADSGVQDDSGIPDKEKILFFAAGAIYEMLPLWVAQGSKCEAEFMDHSRYHPYAQDKGVVAWPVDHSHPDGKRNIKFKIKAMSLEMEEHQKRQKDMYEKMLRHIRRQDRKREKESRSKGEGIVHEEL